MPECSTRLATLIGPLWLQFWTIPTDTGALSNRSWSNNLSVSRRAKLRRWTPNTLLRSLELAATLKKLFGIAPLLPLMVSVKYVLRPFLDQH
jgi:hypothetical protein